MAAPPAPTPSPPPDPGDGFNWFGPWPDGGAGSGAGGPDDPTVPGAAAPGGPDDPTVPGEPWPDDGGAGSGRGSGAGRPDDPTVVDAGDPPTELWPGEPVPPSAPGAPVDPAALDDEGAGVAPPPPPPPPPAPPVPPPPAGEPWASGPYRVAAPAGGSPAWAAVRTFLTAPFRARTWLEYLYLVAAAPLALAGLIAIIVCLSTGAFLTVTLIGIPLLAGTILLARELGHLHRGLANGLLGTNVPAPRRAVPKPGLFGWLKTSLLEVSGWRGIAYLVLATPVTVVGLYGLLLAWGVSIGMLVYPVLWQVFEPTQTAPDGTVHHSAMQFGDYYIETWPRALGVAAIGLVGLFLVPWVARAVTGIDRLLVRGLLGPTRMSERVVDLEATRAQAVDASAAELRRIERDLHDGTQARLVALAMHLDMAKEKLAGAGASGGAGGSGGSGSGDDDLVRAWDLLDTAHRNATEAIVELRDVTRSIHPPALDKGLDAALATLAARSGVPATVRASIAVRPSPAIETIAYFCVAELLTNVAKHSGASRTTVDVTGDARRLRMRVSDDGRGGAGLRPGGGLAGLAERVRTVDGRLDIASPPGGPTLVTVDLPSGS